MCVHRLRLIHPHCILSCMQKFYNTLHSWLSVLATLLCHIYLILDVAMTLDGNGLWYFDSFYGNTTIPFSISAYTGNHILICMFSFLLIILFSMLNPRLRFFRRVYVYDAK